MGSAEEMKELDRLDGIGVICPEWRGLSPPFRPLFNLFSRHVLQSAPRNYRRAQRKPRVLRLEGRKDSLPQSKAISRQRRPRLNLHVLTVVKLKNTFIMLLKFCIRF
jgi:hypothetical protein